jgi:nicotinate-nucleotide adenylyltransferase
MRNRDYGSGGASLYRIELTGLSPVPSPILNRSMRLGIFGGSFDPVHNGHLELARCCQREAALDEIWFTPTAIQPLKQGGPQATNYQRLEMLRLAIGDSPDWRICTLEFDRGGFSYTVDTLRQIHTELRDAELFFLVGADALGDLPHWKEPAEIFQLAAPLIVHRAGGSHAELLAAKQLCPADHQPQVIDMPAMPESSTEIRHRVASGEPIDAFLPTAVARYIAEHGVYR